MSKRDDHDRLQGTWTIATLAMDGQTMPAGMLAGAAIAIEGDRFTTTGMGAPYGGRIVVAAAARPRAIDLVFTSGPPAGMTHPAIYELKGDALTLCIATRGSTRPKTFAAPAGSGFALETLVRGATKATGKTTAAVKPGVTKTKASSAAAGKSGPTEIDGEWQMVSGVLDGVTMDASLIQWVRRVTQGGVTTVKAGPQTMMKAEFSVDRAAKPRTIDYRHLHGTHKDKTQLGIYSLKAGELTILMGAPGGARPITFAPKPPKGGTLTVWKRV